MGSIGQDINLPSLTKQEEIEKALKDSRSDLEFAIDAAQLGTWDYNPLNNQFTSNQRLKEWFGLEPEEHIELTHAVGVMLESDRQRVTDAIQKALDFSSGGNYDIEYTIVHPVSKKAMIVRARGRAWFNDKKIAYRFNGTIEDITEKAASLQKIKESVERFNHLIYSSPSAIGILYGEDLVISVANDAIIEIWGKGKEIIGKSYFEALPELAEQGYGEVFAHVYKTGIPFNAVETPVHILQKGEMTLKYYNFLLYPQRNINNQIDGIGIIATEVTSQALLNKKMKESEQRFVAAVQAVQGILWTNNAKGEMEGEQLGWSELTGQKFEDYQGYGWANAVHPDDVLPTIDAWKEAVRRVRTFHFEHRVKVKDGSWRDFSIKAIPLLNDDGSLREWVGVHTDITENKQSARALKENEEKLNIVIEASELGTWELDLKTDEAKYSGKYLEIFGYKNGGSLAHDQLVSHIHQDDLPVRAHALNQAFQNGSLHFAFRIVWDDGSLHWVEAKGKVFYDGENKPSNLIGTVRDITDEKKFLLEQINFADEFERQVQQRTKELEEKNVELEKINKELQAFAYISSHDLQEPLRKIQTFASYITEKENETLSDKGRQMFRRMQAAALRMQTLINDLLAYSRTNTAERIYVMTDLNKVVDEVRTDLKEELLEKHATVEAVNLCFAKIIPFQFRQLLLNLISNSLKFSDPSRPPRIQIKSRIVSGKEINNDMFPANATCYHICVSDNGIGFDQQYSTKIFELFQRLHGKQEYDGTGIGLAIVKKIIENHAGLITAHGELDKGAHFDIYIPATDPE